MKDARGSPLAFWVGKQRCAESLCVCIGWGDERCVGVTVGVFGGNVMVDVCNAVGHTIFVYLFGRRLCRSNVRLESTQTDR